MSNYTITLQEYISSQALLTYTGNSPMNYVASLSIDDIHTYGIELFPKTFPFYVATLATRLDFMYQFIDHFYFSEIGSETIGQFKWRLRDYLNIRMPYYTQLYNSQIKDLDELYIDTDYKKERTETGKDNRTTSKSGSGTDNTNTTRSGSTSNNGSGNNIAYVYPVNNNGVASEQSKTSSTSETSGTASETGTNERSTSSTESGTDNLDISRNETETYKGYQGLNKSEYIKAYRDLIVNINQDIFADMQDWGLFMRLWL